MFKFGRGADSDSTPYQPAHSPYLRMLPQHHDTPDGRELERAELSGCAPAGATIATAGSGPEDPVRGCAGHRLTSTCTDDRGSNVQDASQVGVLDQKGAVAAADSHPAPAALHPPASTAAVDMSNDGEGYGGEPRSPRANVLDMAEHDALDMASLVVRESSIRLHQAEQRAEALKKELGETEDLATSETERAIRVAERSLLLLTLTYCSKFFLTLFIVQQP